MQEGYVVYSILALLHEEMGEEPHVFLDPQLVVAQDEQEALNKVLSEYPELADQAAAVDLIITTIADTTSKTIQIINTIPT